MDWAIEGGELVLFGKYRVKECIAATDTTRDLDVVELWSGVGAIANAATEGGHSSCAFDLSRIPGVTNVPGEGLEDILTEPGFAKALHLVCRLRKGGLLVEAPVCSSFVFPDSANTKRKAGEFSGDETYRPVSQGNCGAMIATFLLLVAIGRSCHGLLENPAGSTLWSFIRQFTQALQKLPTVIVDRCSYDSNPYPRIGKRYKLSGTGAWIKKLARPCQCPDKTHQLLMYKCSTGVRGNTDLLRESAAYPIAMGMNIVALWELARGLDAGLAQECLSAVWVTGDTVSTRRIGKSPKFDRLQQVLDPWADATGPQESDPQLSDPWGCLQGDDNFDEVAVQSSKRRRERSTAFDPWAGCGV